MRKYSCSTCGRIHKRGETCKQKVKQLSEYKRSKEEEKVYRTYQWTKTRKEVLDLQNDLCYICKELFKRDNSNRINIATDVHHIKSVKSCLKDNELDLLYSLDNLIGLCSYHHRETHSKDLDNKNKINNYYSIEIDNRFDINLK